MAIWFQIGIVLNGVHWTFQLGEHVAITGIAGLLVLLGLFTLPFVASAVWAARRAHASGTTPPMASRAQEDGGDSEADNKDINGLRYSVTRV
jgi:hypothetical protein